MSWIDNIRNKPHSYKVRLMWIIVISAAVLLILAWIMFSRIGSNIGTASDFISEQVKGIQKNGQKMYEENK